MLPFYQRGDILHFSRYFTSFWRGSYLISLSPIFSLSFPDISLFPLPLSSSSNPVSSISCAIPEFSPPLPSRTLEKGTFLQFAVTVSSSIASQKLCRSSAEALRKLYRSSCHTATTRVYGCYASTCYLFISCQKRILFNSTPLHSTPQYYPLSHYYTCLLLHK